LVGDKALSLAIATVILLSVLPSAFALSEEWWVSYRVVEEVVLENAGALPYPLSESDKRIRIFPSGDRQRVVSYEAEVEVDGQEVAVSSFLKKDVDGNNFLEANLPPSLSSGSCLRIRLVQVVEVYVGSLSSKLTPQLLVKNSGSFSDIPDQLRKEFCSSKGAWNLDSPKLKHISSIAKELAGEDQNVLSVMLRFVKWIGEHVRYPSEPSGPRYPYETYPAEAAEQQGYGVGDCDDQASLFVAMCRSVGIPAYLEVGCIYFPQTQPKAVSLLNEMVVFELRQIRWHGWAMAYVPLWGWLPIDLTMGFSKTGNPLDAVRKSAYLSPSTVVSEDIVASDYVAEWRSFEESVLEYGIKLSQVDKMEVVGYFTKQVNWPVVYAAIACLAAYVAALAWLYTKVRKRSAMLSKGKTSFIR